jgi:TP901 family phage tail tape measure protein
MPRVHFNIDSTERVGPSVNSAVRHMKRFSAETLLTGRAVERSTNRIHSGFSRLTRFMTQQLTGTIRSFFYGLRMGVVGAGVAVSAFVVTSLKSFRDFDKKLRETTALLAGSGGGKNSLKGAFKEAEKNYKDFYKTILQMAPQMRRTPQELSSGLYELVQAGLKGPAAKRLLKPAAMGATAGGGTVDASSRVLVQIMNALRMGTKQKGSGKAAQGVMDQIFQAINLGVGVDFTGMSSGIGKFIGAAGTTFKGGRKGGSDSLKQLLATYIFSTQQGARQADVGVGIQDVIKTIANPSAKGAGFAKKIGLGSLGSSFLEKHGFVGSLQVIIAKMKEAGYTGAKLNDAIGKLFGDVRGRRIVSYATNTAMVTEALNAMDLATGATKRSFDEQGKSLDAAAQKFKSYWETLKIGLGGATAPFAIKGMSAIENVLGNAGVIGRGQDLLEKGRGMDADKRAAWRKNLGPEDQVAYSQAQQWNKNGIGGKIKQVGNSALSSLSAWWRNPATQSKFNSALQSMIQRSFSLLGAGIRTIPSIYTFGRRVAGEILRGVVDGLKDAAGGVLSSVMGGGGGGGGLGGAPSNGFEAVAGGLLGVGITRMGRGRGRGGMGLAAGAGAMAAGLPAPVAAMIALAPMLTGKIGMGKSKASALADQMVQTMNVKATTVHLAGGITGGGGGGGGRMLRPGYTYNEASGRFMGPKAGGGKGFASAADATIMIGGGGGGAPAGGGIGAAPAGAAIISEKAAKDTERRLGRMRTAALRYRDAISMKGAEIRAGVGATPVGRAARTTGGKAAMYGGLGATTAAAGGMDWTQMALTGIGAAGFALGPEVGIPLMLATGALGGYLGSRGQKDPGEGFMDVLSGKIGKDVTGPKGKFRTGGAGAVMGKGIGDVGMLVNKNPGKIKGTQRVLLFTKELDAAVGTRWDKSDTFNAHLGEALRWAGNSPAAIAGVQRVYDEWNDYALGQAANFAGYEATGSNVGVGRTDAEKRIGKGLHGKGKPKEFTSKFGTGTYDPRGGMSRGAPMNAPNVGFGFGAKKGKRKGIPSVWDASLDLMNAPAVGKALQKSGSDPIIGSVSFVTGLTHGLNDAKRTSKPKIKAFMDDMAATALAMAGGGTATSGPSSNAPPNPGTGSRFNNAATASIPSNGINGAEASAFGPAMMTAGGAMADKVSNTIAESVAKKQMEGPIGDAQKGLRWLYQQVGKPYIWGGGHPPGLNLAGYDCSGLASSALMAMGSKLSGTTFDMIGNTAPGAGLVQLGFNPATNPHHMGISVMGKWFEAAHTGAPIRGPGEARSSWPYVGAPKFHSGGVYHSGNASGEGGAILKDGELVVRPTNDGGLQAQPVQGAMGGMYINGPLIGTAHIRSDRDIHRVAEELADLLERKKQNSGRAG